MGTAVDALRLALERGDVGALGPAYGRNAQLDASLPGGRRRHHGRASIVEELARWWDGRGEAIAFDAAVFERGAALWTERDAALWTERDGVRLRHYLHFSGDLISRHWVYSARPRGAFGGNSGAAVERRGELVVKRVVPNGGWMGRATRDALGRSARLWLDGQIARLPVQLDTAIQRVESDGDGYLIYMRDISEHLIGEERRLGADELYAVLGAAAGMHREFHGEDVRSATRVEDMLAIASPATIAREIGETDLAPKQMPAGWEAFAQAAPDDIASAVAALLADPAPLARALARDGLTLIHGDLRDD